MASIGVRWHTLAFVDVGWRSLRYSTLLDKLSATNTGILFVVDEVDGGLEEMVQLATVFQLLIGENKKVALFMAGLPYHVSSLLLGKTTSFFRRAQQFKLGRIPDYSIKEAFRLTIQEGGKTIEKDALALAVQEIDGFPFLLQLVGFRSWKASGDSATIQLDHVKQGAEIAKEELKDRIFTSTMEELSGGDKEFLFAMNRNEEYTQRQEIAKATGRDSSWISRYKKRLLEAGIIEEPRQGKFRFSLPSFATYLDEEAEFL